MKKHKSNQSLTLAIAFALGCCVFSTSNAFAEESAAKAELAFDLEGITVEAARPDWESKLSPGSVTVIRPDDYKGEQKTLPDLMRKVPGVHVREVNGKGQYTTVTVRGSTAAQVGIFIDGVLSNLGGDAAADLSTIPVSNVERIEVYRGYIPARFAGTYIGGVINIVTKKPEKTDVNMELGKSSYGGKKGAIEIFAPLGDGSLMIGTNYESSDGDFRYENYAAIANREKYAGFVETYHNKVVNDDIENMEAYGFKGDKNQWIEYVNNGVFLNDYRDSLQSKTFDSFISTIGENNLINHYGSDYYLKASDDWNNNNQIMGQSKDIFLNEYALKINDSVKPGDNPDLTANQKLLEEAKKKLSYAENAERSRKYNDYEKIDSIIKWQNDNWMIKGAWNKTDRHLPDGLWLGSTPSNAIPGYIVDVYDAYKYDSRRQKIDTKELLVQNRNTAGNLEWGWMLDYTNTYKSYRAEHVMDEDVWDDAPFRKWSEYNSNKYNGQIDGTYKLSDNNMLDFQINFSHEKMDLDGDRLNEVLEDGDSSSIFAQTRNKYEQDILNVQLQDTITLDKESSWFITPSIKYNRSTITGYSDGKRFGSGDYSWISPKDEQTDSKATWQLALKKEFDDNFTMRMTGGTYYRLLNMYEIAGDGAGVLPAPNKDGDYRSSTFPVPEEGKQFDVSAIWNGNALGADNRTTLTYFWRDSENMLQLQRYGKDYWCYMNDVRGTVNGVELQSSFNWNKFDLDLQATYMKADAQKRNSATVGGYNYIDVQPTYQPKWEGNIRLTYRPTDPFAVFTEVHYTGAYYTSNAPKNGTGAYDADAAGGEVDDLLVFNTGIKYKLRDSWQLNVGCNDVFNNGPKQKILTDTKDGTIYVNTEFPLQGRTYYITLKHSF